MTFEMSALRKAFPSNRPLTWMHVIVHNASQCNFPDFSARLKGPSVLYLISPLVTLQVPPTSKIEAMCIVFAVCALANAVAGRAEFFIQKIHVDDIDLA